MYRQDHLAAIRRSVNLLVLIAVFVTCYFAKDLLLPVLIGVLIALTLSPITRALSRVGIPYPVSAFMLILLLALILAAVLTVSAGTITAWMDDSHAIARALQDKLASVFRQVESVRQAGEDVAQMATGTGAAVQEVVVKQPTLLSSAMSAAGNLGATLAVALVLAIFLLSSGDLFYIKLVQSFRTMTGKKRALTMVYDIERRVSRYLLTITLINAGLGVTIGATLTAIGLPYGYLWGVIAFALNFLPYIGAVTGTVLVGIFALITFDSLSYALLAPLAYLSLSTVEGNFLTPTIVGRSLELNAVAVFLTVVSWGWLWGVAGALVAVPFLVVFKVVCDNIDSMKVVGNFLGSADFPPRAEPTSDKT